MGAFGGVPSPFPAAEDDQVREQRDLARRQMENAAARSLEASTIGKGGLLVKDGGSITVEAPGTIDLQGGAFSSATLTATSTISAGSTISTPGTVQGGAVTSTGDVTASGRVTSASPIRSVGSRNYVVGTSYAGAWIELDGTFGIQPSSIRFKTDIEEWAPDISRLLLLRAVMFRYDLAGAEPNAPKQLGFIAEELDALGFPEFLFYDSDGLVEGINYDRIVVALLMLAKQQETRIQNMEARLLAAGL